MLTAFSCVNLISSGLVSALNQKQCPRLTRSRPCPSVDVALGGASVCILVTMATTSRINATPTAAAARIRA